MARIRGDAVELDDLEELLGGNDDEVSVYYDPAEGGWVFEDKVNDEKRFVVGQSGLDAKGTDLAGVGGLGLQTLEGWEWYNVAEHGVDNTGATAVGADIEALIDDGRVLFFPEGTYYVQDRFFAAGDHPNVEDLAFVGNNATFLIDSDITLPVGSSLISAAPIENFVFEGIDLDQTAADTGARFIRASVTDYGRIEDVTVNGEDDRQSYQAFNLDARTKNARLDVKNISLPDGRADSAAGLSDDSRDPRGGIWTGGENAGTVVYDGCHIENFPYAGLDTAYAGGLVVVEQGLYRNNKHSGVRAGGQYAVVNAPRIEIDEAIGGGRGLRLESRRYGNDDSVDEMGLALVYGAKVRNTGESAVRGISVYDSIGGFIIDKPEVRQTVPAYAISGGGEHPAGAVIRDAFIESTADRNADGYDDIMYLNAMHDAVIERPTIRGTTGDSTGGQWGIRAGPGMTIRDPDIHTDRRAIRTYGIGPTTVRVENCRNIQVEENDHIEWDHTGEAIMTGEVEHLTVWGQENVDRVIYNGVSDNGTDDPASAGPWNGVSRDGITVRWEDANGNEHLSTYVDGSWRASPVGRRSNGKDAQTGDGAATTFTITHGLPSAPSYVSVDPATEAASTDRWVTADATDITIEYAAAPADGDALEWWWEAEV